MTLFDSRAHAQIRDWDKTVNEQIRIELVPTDHARKDLFVDFAQKLAEMAPHLTIETRPGQRDLPAFLVRENIAYSALPLERELDPFLDALSQPISSAATLSAPIRKALDAIDIPVRLTLYIALACPHCPHVVRTLIPMAMACSHIDLQIIDGSLFPETAEKDGVLSAPCLILDDDFRWTGNVEPLEIIQMITSRDPSQLSAGTLKNILEQGDASWIVGQMIKKGAIFDAFISLLVHDTWSVRLGAMVVVEELAGTDPKLAARLSPILIQEFDGKDVTVQGDILYALGETGDRETFEWIQSKLPALSHQDLVDAANDALEALDT
jgi:glutaredoxin